MIEDDRGATTPRSPAPRSTRRNALIATAIALPVTLILALALAPSPQKPSNGTLGSVTVTAPPTSPISDGPCTQILTALPTELKGLAPRKVTSVPESPYVLAWGDPAIVFRCGVARPVDFVATSYPILSGVYWLQTETNDTDIFTAVDRAVYVELRVPKKLTVQPLPIVGDAIASKLPPVCQIQESLTSVVPEDQLCTHRS